STANLVRVQKLLASRMGRDVFMYSITLDPAHDTPKVLARYARAFGVGPGWLFLTGDAADLEALRRNLGYVSPDPVEDKDRSQHIGMLRMGIEPLERWAACASLARPEWIVQSLVRLEPRRSAEFTGRKVPAVDGLLEKFFRVVLPELGDGRHRHDDGVLQLAVALAFYLADVGVLDRIVVAVELHGSAGRIAELNLPERGQQLLAILDGAAEALDRLVDPAPAGVVGLREVRRHLAEARPVLLDEAAILRRVERRAVDERADDAERLVAHRRQERFVDGRAAGDQRDARLQS